MFHTRGLREVLQGLGLRMGDWALACELFDGCRLQRTDPQLGTMSGLVLGFRLQKSFIRDLTRGAIRLMIYTLRCLKDPKLWLWEYGPFLIMGNSGFISSAVRFLILSCSSCKVLHEPD